MNLSTGIPARRETSAQPLLETPSRAGADTGRSEPLTFTVT